MTKDDIDSDFFKLGDGYGPAVIDAFCDAISTSKQIEADYNNSANHPFEWWILTDKKLINLNIFNQPTNESRLPRININSYNRCNIIKIEYNNNIMMGFNTPFVRELREIRVKFIGGEEIILTEPQEPKEQEKFIKLCRIL